MVVPDTLLRHLAPAREWPLCAHTSCSNNTLHIYESGRDATGEKSGEVWTVWLNLLIQNQVVQPHNKKSNQNKPRISGVILIWFLSCGCTTWFCIKRFIHIVNTSPAFPQNVHIQVGQTSQTRYCKPTKISSLSEQRYNFCKFAICNYLVAVQSGLAFKY